MKPWMAFVIAACAAVAEPAGADNLSHADVKALASTMPAAEIAYGDDPLQVGELRLPAGEGPFPVAIVIHGGCWTKSIGATREYMQPLASALTANGIATWNVEYRQMGDAGAGWPGTFLDWGAAADHLRALADRYPLDLSQVTAIGHSAGAHAALFLASRQRLPEDSEIRGDRPLPIQAVVSLDGPADLAAGRMAAAEICGVDGIEAVMGGLPEAVPQRYQQGSPAALLPLGVPQLIVSSVIMPPDQGEAYRSAALRAGDAAELLVLKNSGHFDMTAPGTASWEMLLPSYLRMMRGSEAK